MLTLTHAIQDHLLSYTIYLMQSRSQIGFTLIFIIRFAHKVRITIIQMSVSPSLPPFFPPRLSFWKVMIFLKPSFIIFNLTKYHVKFLWHLWWWSFSDCHSSSSIWLNIMSNFCDIYDQLSNNFDIVALYSIKCYLNHTRSRVIMLASPST